MFIQLTYVTLDDNEDIIYKPIFVNTDHVKDFVEDYFIDKYDVKHNFVTVSYGENWIRVKESMRDISALIGVKMII